MQQTQENSVNNLVSGTDGVALRELAQQMRAIRDRVVAEVGRVVVGMEGVTHQFLIALLGAGHVLLEGCRGWRRRPCPRRSPAPWASSINGFSSPPICSPPT